MIKLAEIVVGTSQRLIWTVAVAVAAVKSSNEKSLNSDRQLLSGITSLTDVGRCLKRQTCKVHISVKIADFHLQFVVGDLLLPSWWPMYFLTLCTTLCVLCCILCVCTFFLLTAARATRLHFVLTIPLLGFYMFILF